MRSSSENSGCSLIIASLAVLVGIFAWLSPFNPVGNSPLVQPQQAHGIQGATRADNAVLQPTEEAHQLVPYSTSTTLPPSSNTSLLPTSTAVPPTETPVLPTETPIPAPTPFPDTLQGTILDIGHMWRQGSVELLLTHRDLYPNTIIAFFHLTNIGIEERTIRFLPENFTAQDNLGNQLAVGGVDWYFQPYVQPTCYAQTVTLSQYASADIHFPCDYGNWGGVAIGIDTADPAISEIILTVSGVSSISDARWRIPLYR